MREKLQRPEDIIVHFPHTPKHLLDCPYYRPGKIPGILGLFFMAYGNPYYQEFYETRQTRPLWLGSGIDLEGRRKDSLRLIILSHNLLVEDFRVIYFPIEPTDMYSSFWLKGTIAFLLDLYRPVWNEDVKGFGSHFKGRVRASEASSPWAQRHLPPTFRSGTTSPSSRPVHH